MSDYDMPEYQYEKESTDESEWRIFSGFEDEVHAHARSGGVGVWVSESESESVCVCVCVCVCVGGRGGGWFLGHAGNGWVEGGGGGLLWKCWEGEASRGGGRTREG